MIRQTDTPDEQGFTRYELTCDECGTKWATTVCEDGGASATRLLAAIFAGWNGDEPDICPKHMELRA